MTAAALPPIGDPNWRNRRVKKKRTWGQRLLLVAIVFACLGVVGLAVAAFAVRWASTRLDEIAYVDVPGVEASGSDVGNWLLVGTDTREGIDPDDPNAGVFLGAEVSGKRTDTIMLVRVDRSTRQVDMVSIPRDLWVPIAGKDESGRINGAYNGDDGRSRLVATVEQNLEVEVNHYAEINFVGFQNVVDVIGGVPIWFDVPVRDFGSGLNIAEAGCHTLDGSQALAFARSRKLEEMRDGQWRTEPGASDLKRNGRQQIFLSQAAAVASSKIDVTEFRMIDKVAKVVGQNLVVEDSAGSAQLLDLARAFSGDDKQVESHELPVSGYRTAGGSDVLILNDEASEEVLRKFRSDGSAPVIASEVGVSAESDEVAIANEVSPPAVGVAEDDEGVGKLGFVAADSPEGTPCSV